MQRPDRVYYDTIEETLQSQRPVCRHTVRYMSRSCGANICMACDDHEGLVRCYCGWTRDGRGNGRQELIEMGEVIDDSD